MRINTMKTLTLSTGSFDQDNTFSISKLKYSRCKLFKDYKVEGDGIYWVMLCSAMLKAEYTDKDREESARLSEPASAVDDGEVVLVDGKQFKVRVLGQYSDCAILDPVARDADVDEYDEADVEPDHWSIDE
jgi:hypothetical protein